MKSETVNPPLPIKAKRYLGSTFTATVATNYVDYQPGDTVVITGSGWQPGETVTLTIVESDGDLPWMSSAVADSAGNIYNNQFVIQAHDHGVSFTLTATGASSGQTASTTFTDNVTVDFKQSANNETTGTITGLGNIHWINSIVQSNNSTYFEGMSNFQRSLFTDVAATTGNVHTLSFQHQFTKGGIHAYDFLTSYAQALQDDSAALGVAIQLNPCGVEIGPPASLSGTCSTLRAGSNFVDVDVPDDPYISKDGSTAAKIAAYEASGTPVHGNRTIRIYGDAPISNASLTLCHDVAAGADTGDSFVHYVLQWTSTSTQILVEMAGHLAVTGNGTGDSWGPGLGSSQINGGPYHFKLDQLGGSVANPSVCPPTLNQVTSLGSQDNQIKGADILIQCPTCSVSGPADPVCPGSTNTHTVSLTGTCTSPSTTWTITGNGTISGSNTGSSVTVIAGSTCNASYTVTATTTCATCPNPTVCSDTVLVNDTTPPTITCPAVTSPIQCPGTPSFPSPTVTDNCDPSPTVTFADVTTPGRCPQESSVTRTWTARDRCGNTATCSQTVNIVDTTAPVISSLPGPSTIECPATPNFTTPTATDACDPNPTLTFADVTTPGSCPQNFSVTRTWTATDHCGNSSTKSQTINVVDTTAPVISDLPGPSTIECPATPSFATPTATDACDPSPTLTFVDNTTPGSCPQASSVTRTWTATDHCGNSSTKSQTINVVDTTPPTITCAGPSTIECPATPSFPPPTVSDACDPNPTLTFADVTTPGTCPQKRSVTRTWTATDHCGNHSSCSQTITVVDTTPPTVNCPAPITVGQCNNVVTYVASATDSCGLQSFGCTPPSGSTFPVGTTTVTCTASDGCNSNSCSFTVTVVPNPSCSITPPSSNPVCGTSGNSLSATVTGGQPPVTRTWSVAGIGWSIDSGQGTDSITYTAGPSAGTATFTLVVVDAFGCRSTCSLSVSCSPPQVDNCTLTQGFYGNQKGKFNGILGTTLVANLLASGDLVVGKPGRSLTIKGGAFASDSAKCLVTRLPGNQTPMCLPDGLGDATLSGFSDCQTTPPLPLNGQKWSNVLLGQVVTLTLNLRLDAAINEPGHVALADRQICNTFVTQGALPGPDGLLGTNDDTINPNSSPTTFSIPVSVTCELTHLGLPHTVGGLLELANRALACQCTATDIASIGDINQAVDAVNRGFDQCRFLLSCTDSSATCPPPATCPPTASLLNPNSGDRTVAQVYSPVVSATFVNRLNLFGWFADSNSLLGKLLPVPVDSEINTGYQRLAGLSRTNVVTHSIRKPANT